MNDSPKPEDALPADAASPTPSEEVQASAEPDAPAERPEEGAASAETTAQPAAEAQAPEPTAERTAEPAEVSAETANATESNDAPVSDAPASESPANEPAPKPAPAISAKEAMLSRAKGPEKPTLKDAAAKENAPAQTSAEKATDEDDSSDGEPRAPKTAFTPAPEKAKRPERVAVPSLRSQDDDLEAELEATLGGDELGTMMMGKDAAAAKASQPLEIDARIRGIVHRVQGENIFFTLGVHEGFAPTRQFKKPPEPGDMLDVVVVSYDEEDGIYEVTIPGAAVSVEDWSDLQKGQLIEAKIVGTNTGGLDALVNHIRAFVPASQIDVVRTENFNEYLGKKLLCEITEVNPGRKRLILSHRRVVEKELEALKEENFKTLQEGQVVEGKVTRIQDFGAFVDIGGGVEGLLHVSKLSWDNVRHPSDVVSEGQAVRVKIDRIQADKGRIGLSLRDLEANPWESVSENYPVGQILEGEVTRIMEFGVFVKLEPGVEGLIHVSELAHHRVIQPRGHAKVGETVQVKILAVEPEKRRISLSKKAVTPGPTDKSGKKKDEYEDLPVERTVKPVAGTLKGGRDQGAGGEQFGLKW